MRAATGARVFAGLGDAAVLRAGGPREAVFSTFYRPNDQPHPTTVDVELKGGESIAFGDVTFHALAMPGHTPGSICYLMERSKLRGALFAGDVILMLAGDEKPHSQKRKPLGTYSAYLKRRVTAATPGPTSSPLSSQAARDAGTPTSYCLATLPRT